MHSTLKHGPGQARPASSTASRRLRVHAAAVEAHAPSNLGLSHQRAQRLLELWDQHIATEFCEKSADHAVETMVPDSTVLHVPTLTGGRGREALRHFYATHFISQMPPDMHIEPLSRAVGKDLSGQCTVTDEFIVSFTHTVHMAWMLPGIAPTNRKVAVPFVAIVKFEGDKLCGERIYWDQATVLKQLGLLPDSIACVPGREQTAKAVSFDSVPSDLLLP